MWLINVDGSRMVALGVLASGDEGEFEVPTGLIEEGYRIVDISVEPDDGDPTHSGVSLARGELADRDGSSSTTSHRGTRNNP